MGQVILSNFHETGLRMGSTAPIFNDALRPDPRVSDRRDHVTTFLEQEGEATLCYAASLITR